jgi:transposase
MKGPKHVEVIDVDDNERVLAVAAAVDVAKATGMVCVRGSHPTIAGRRVSKVWEVQSTTAALIELGDHLVGLGVERVVVESTSDYWRPFFYLLETAGLSVWLVNARDVKQVSGRPKTDKLDAVWLAKLNERGMLRPSFVPPTEIRALRDYTRLRTELVEERSRHKQPASRSSSKTRSSSCPRSCPICSASPLGRSSRPSSPVNGTRGSWSSWPTRA